jgi:exodeoxyribonuclease-1
LSFVFFDTETTGLKPGFDQIVHFAAIRTDSNLEEIDRFEARSRLLPHVVPHPTALRTNGLPIAQLIDRDLPSHYEMVRAMRQKLLSWSPSIFVGYNSIRFDEEMLRHALFQTLHPAYLTSKHGNCRADVLSLVMAASAISPTCLTVPLGLEGRATFRLEQVAAANSISHVKAHDAMADAAATLALCRCVQERAPELWQRFVRFSNKATVADFVDSEDGFFLTEFFANEVYHAPVVCIGRDPEQPNGRLCLTLNGDVDLFSAMTDDDVRAALGMTPSPIRRFRINAAPTLTALYDASDQMLSGMAADEIESRGHRIKADPSLCARLVRAYIASRKPYQPSPYVEGRLHDEFPGPDDEVRMAEFHDVSWPDAFSISQRFEDERLRVFGSRLVYFESRSALAEGVRRDLERTLTDRLIDDNGGGLTLSQALSATEEILNDTGSDPSGILADYRKYLIDRIVRVNEYRTKQLAI